jgi:alkanesulfonate monooxygenase SsuD/methylene tetrahydromethanopterin reductase-like flavin-dependent oxidoreductase (luciferase family)
MKFGVQFFPISTTTRSAATYFEECIRLAVDAEKLGFTHARVVEHYFEPYGGWSPNPIVLLSAIASRTSTLRLVTGAVLPIFNHPLKLAGEIGMLDAISNGRLDVGFARAFLPHEFRRFKIPLDESQSRFHEGLEQVHLLLTSENVSSIGSFHSFEGITSLPRPTQKPRPKFYVAATQTAETFEFAGRMGHGLMAIPIAPIKPLIQIYREAWKAAGHTGHGEVMVAFHMFCDEDGGRARQTARQPFDLYFSALGDSSRDWLAGANSKDYRDYDKAIRKLTSVTMQDQIHSGAAWIGSPAELRLLIHRVRETIGPFEHASLQVNFGDLRYDVASRSLELFCREVAPACAHL